MGAPGSPGFRVRISVQMFYNEKYMAVQDSTTDMETDSQIIRDIISEEFEHGDMAELVDRSLQMTRSPSRCSAGISLTVADDSGLCWLHHSNSILEMDA